MLSSAQNVATLVRVLPLEAVSQHWRPAFVFFAGPRHLTCAQTRLQLDAWSVGGCTTQNPDKRKAKHQLQGNATRHANGGAISQTQQEAT
jgi:hypothetical protein